MHSSSSPARSRGRAVVVAIVIGLGVFASVGIGHAAVAPAAPTAAEPDGGGTVCADGRRDTNSADGVCNRDQKSGGEGEKAEGEKAEGKKAEGKGDGKDEGTVCADGKRDTDPSNGVCTRDAAKEPPPDPNLVAGTPCTKSTRACVDLNAKKAWLIENDKVVRGPVRIAHGGPGHETPRGTFVVQWKNKDHRSMEYDNAPMPFAVFFTDGGVAFHQGDLGSNSHGCVRLSREDAEAFFNFLKVDDGVQVH